MKIRVYIFLLFLSPLILNAQTKEKFFKISVEQNGKSVKLVDNTYKLERKSFDLVVHFKESKKAESCVQIRVDTSDVFFDMMSEKIDIEKINFYKLGTGLAEYPNNKEKSIFLDNRDVSHHHWCFDSKSENCRFREVKKEKKWKKGFYEIDNFFFMGDNIKVNVEDFKANTLYFIVITESRNNEKKRKIVQKKLFKIKFIR